MQEIKYLTQDEAGRFFSKISDRRDRAKLGMAQEILGDAIAYEQPEESQKTFEEWFFELTGIEPGICPFCKKGRLIRKVQLAPAPS